MSDIDLTVALPVYNSSKILWLCLEGLCNQKTSYNWELIVCEDPSNLYAGEDYLKPYTERLRAAGCSKCTYIPLDSWIPLGTKWKLIGDKAIGKNFMLTAADNYSPNNRIQLSCERLTGDIKWFDCRESLFYNINTRDQGHINISSQFTGVWMCTKTELVKQLKGIGPKNGIDNWMQKQFKLSSYQKTTESNYMLGFHTDGMNNISVGRKQRYLNSKYNDLPCKMAHWSKPVYTVKSVLSDTNFNRLDKLAELQPNDKPHAAI